MARTIDGRLAYADLLRVLATIAAVVLYISAAWMDQAAAGSAARSVLVTYNAMMRWCVPLFAMLSGAFLLDPKKSVKLLDVFLRYILRALAGLLVWGALYALVDYVRAGGGFTWAGLSATLGRVLWADTHHHLWFLYIMIGLYLVTPILRAFVRGASRRDLHWFFLLCFLFCSLLPILAGFFPRAMALPMAWADRFDVHLVLGWVGYYVAGYYLKNYTLGRLAEFIIYILGILGAVVTLWGASRSSLLLDWHAPNLVFFSVAIFVLFRYVLGISEERSRRQRLGGVARVSYGVYVLHAFFIMLLDFLDITTLSFNPILAVPVLGGVVFLLSFAVAWVISKIPLLGHYLT